MFNSQYKKYKKILILELVQTYYQFKTIQEIEDGILARHSDIAKVTTQRSGNNLQK